MRRIKKRAEPPALVQWRAANQANPAVGGINYGYDLLRKSPAVVASLRNSLLAEQGGLCAYTGRRIDATSAHIEHLLPQTPWKAYRGLDVSYKNMAGCWPEPNGQRGRYGAHPKEDWPAPGKEALFVSPLSAGCEKRFAFNQRGEISPANPKDKAAATTIQKLKLDHKLLTALRGVEIAAVLGDRQQITLKKARQRLRDIQQAETALDDGNNILLDPYSFALKQALLRFIKAAERIKKYSKAP